MAIFGHPIEKELAKNVNAPTIHPSAEQN